MHFCCQMMQAYCCSLLFIAGIITIKPQSSHRLWSSCSFCHTHHCAKELRGCLESHQRWDSSKFYSLLHGYQEQWNHNRVHCGCPSPFPTGSYAAPTAVCVITMMGLGAKTGSLMIAQQHDREDTGQSESERGRQEQAVRPSMTCTVVTGHQLPI